MAIGCGCGTGLYDNKLVADYINRVGQRLVAGDSDRLFAFRLLANPIPSAYTLSTGTIYISTGLVSLLDNEAQLAYVLAHEMGHVQFDHWKLKSTLALAQEEFAAKDGRRRAMWGAGTRRCRGRHGRRDGRQLDDCRSGRGARSARRRGHRDGMEQRHEPRLGHRAGE